MKPLKPVIIFLFLVLSESLSAIDISPENLNFLLEQGGEDRLKAIWISYDTKQYFLFRKATQYLITSNNESEHLMILRIFDLLGSDLEVIVPNWHILLDEFISTKRPREVLLPALQLAKKWKERRLVYALIRLTKHPDQEIRKASIEILKELSSDRIVPIIIQFLKSPSELLKIYGLEVSRNYRDQRLIPFLRELLQHPNKTIRIYTIHALAEYENEHFYVFRNYPYEITDVKKELLKIIGEKKLSQHTSYLLEGLKDPDKQIRKTSIMALRSFTDPQLAKPVSQQLKDEKEEDILYEGIITLTHYKQDPHRSLVTLLQHKNPKIRLLVLKSIQEMKDTYYLTHLLQALQSEDVSLLHLEIVYTVATLLDHRNYKSVLDHIPSIAENLTSEEKYLLYFSLKPFLQKDEEEFVRMHLQIF